MGKGLCFVLRRGEASLGSYPANSNYPEWIGIRDGVLIDRELVCEHFPAAQIYNRFVWDYLSGLERLPRGIEEYLLE